MTTPTANVPFDALQFLGHMRHRSFSYVGAATLLRAHLMLAPFNRIAREDVFAIFRATAPVVRVLIGDVIDHSFREDEHGMVYSPAIDRAAAASAEAA